METHRLIHTYMNEYAVHCTFLRPDEIYHVSVMPCYDKKLEASREDFYNDIYRTRDVDCVITSGRARIGLKIQYHTKPY